MPRLADQFLLPVCFIFTGIDPAVAAKEQRLKIKALRVGFQRQGKRRGVDNSGVHEIVFRADLRLRMITIRVIRNDQEILHSSPGFKPCSTISPVLRVEFFNRFNEREQRLSKTKLTPCLRQDCAVSTDPEGGLARALQPGAMQPEGLLIDRAFTPHVQDIGRRIGQPECRRGRAQLRNPGMRSRYRLRIHRRAVFVRPMPKRADGMQRHSIGVSIPIRKRKPLLCPAKFLPDKEEP